MNAKYVAKLGDVKRLQYDLLIYKGQDLVAQLGILGTMRGAERKRLLTALRTAVKGLNQEGEEK